MVKQNKQYAILGLGIFGSTIAKTLSNANCEVIAIDKDIESVQRLADCVTSAVKGDITDIEVLRNAGVGECDIAVVAVGSHLEESIMAVFNVRELGVPFVVAKAKNKRYMEVLKKVGAHKVVRPEKEMGVVTAKSLLNDNIIERIAFDNDYSVIEINTPKIWVNKTLINLNLRDQYGINILGIRRPDEKMNVTPSPDYILHADDHIVLIAESENLEKLNILFK
ncbi:trk system potassium uptake protein TrkA [Breznakia sp. PF5-3]|uniref:potassium channel family protein n=1 Tax=unclassified Breznakia TaxID=2623764 RepID=UPI002405C49C|nr:MULTISPECIES: TrkA family potassium uptake protein [unclassified Breznakia]MDF9824496.1 trk system potassium uptake protein TrkA [Breznakia sp. PM6-1]MDF9835282.1 trk system potassium uptake protein TrkA [Breznakia sp. PF5-3]MDF9836998.1 trk system potassium uptake protein TrkA [Breznakia sp. PFB2-8]MDF9858923.1 trk system potassium uptake protein TrkA [Breznakia sp. PH5-24]